VSISRARQLLKQASLERERLRRHLLVAAAVNEVVPEAIVVGGTAEEYWTADAYHETDLDLCAPFARIRDALSRLGFVREGRHWVRDDVNVAIEAPASRIDGDERRAISVEVGNGIARIIGVEDLYLDRLTQATATRSEGESFVSALSIAAARYDRIDWAYVLARIGETKGVLGADMSELDTEIRRRVLRSTT
jgi:hypothetical protein